MTTETWVLHAMTGIGWRTQREGHLLSCQTLCRSHADSDMRVNTHPHTHTNTKMTEHVHNHTNRHEQTRGMTDRLQLSGGSSEIVNKSVTEQYAPNMVK